jgi:hypothetical protein
MVLAAPPAMAVYICHEIGHSMASIQKHLFDE